MPVLQDLRAESPANQKSRSIACRVGDLLIDTDRARVTRDGVELPLPRLSFDLLMALVESAPGIASLDFLLARVWPGLVVNPETVSQRVKLLRSALGDDPRRPRYIEVARGRGYRLIPEVTSAEPGSQVALPGVADAPATARARTPWWRGPQALASLLTLLLAGVALWMAADRPRGTPTVVDPERSIAVLPFEYSGNSPADPVLALGVAEAVLHRLANTEDLTVIARTSSFAVERRGRSAQDIGRVLGARYLLEGSVQSADERLRITAQLIDAMTGAHVWSLQFNRDQREVFAMQDEIANRVAQSLQLSLTRPDMAAGASRGTQNLDAYFEYLQARGLMATGRVADMREAGKHLTRALAIDGNYARAMAELAGNGIRLAEYDHGPNRRNRFEAATTRAQQLLARAIELDPGDGRVWLERGYLRSFTDLAAAESDLRRGLSLSPNDAEGHERLAAVLYQDPARHGEALQALIRASRIDPLEPRYDVTRAVFHLYGRSDSRTTQAILAGTLARHPRYAPAVERMGEVHGMSGQIAEAIRYYELSLTLDGSSEMVLRLLIGCYVTLGWPEASESLLKPDDPVRVRRLAMQLTRHQWVEAGESAYAALEAESDIAPDEDLMSLALRRHARATGQVTLALATLEDLADLHWDDAGMPVMGETFDMKSAAVGVVDLLQLSGQRERAELLLHATLGHLQRQTEVHGQGPLWTRPTRARLLALLGDQEGAMQMLQEANRDGSILLKHWLHLDLDPAFDALRQREDFQRLQSSVAARIAVERRRVEELRRSGAIPVRPPPA